jgi:hypothetical protein
VKIRPRAHHIQGFIERGKAPFMQVLQDWMQVNNTDSWHIGACIANQQMNNHHHEGRDMLTPFQIYYSQEDEKTFDDILGESAWHILIEVGWKVVEVPQEISSRHAPRG